MISIENVNYKYKTGKTVLKDINLKINDGEVVCIIGKNGSGKSTLSKLISGIMKPTEGNIFINNINVSDKKNFESVRKQIGIVFQNPDSQILFNKVSDDVEFALKNLKIDNKEARIEKALKEVDMYEFKDSDTFELSLGQKQRVNIASILAIGTSHIVLDEPTTMIDSYGKENIYKIVENLKKEKKTIVYVTNNINEILLSDRIVVVQEGNVKHILNRNDLLNNLDILKESEIKVPDILDLVSKLKEIGIKIDTNVMSMENLIENIIGEIKKNEKYC